MVSRESGVSGEGQCGHPRSVSASNDTKPTVADFIAWLETQPPEETYDWSGSPRPCLIRQYLVARENYTGENYWHIAQTLGMEYVAIEEPRAFGAALKRARSAIAAAVGDRTDVATSSDPT